jgi:hypothetical protein
VRPNSSADTTKYDVCLSFASEQRSYAEQVAHQLRLRGVRVFYDVYEQAGLWGTDLTESLQKVYGEQSRYCVLFASAAYERSMWTKHERRSALERALRNWNADYILPVRFDETAIPGLHTTIGYIDGTTTSPEELVELILAKLAHFQARPPVKRAARKRAWRWSYTGSLALAGLVVAIIVFAQEIGTRLGGFVEGLRTSPASEQVVEDATGEPPWVVEGHGYRFALEKVAHDQGTWQFRTKPALVVTGTVIRSKASDHSDVKFEIRDQAGMLLESVPFRGSGNGNPPLNQPGKVELVVWNNSSTLLTITIHDFFWPDGRDLILRNVPVP